VKGQVFALAFSPDGKLLASGGEIRTDPKQLHLHESELRLWDVATGKEVHKLEGHGSTVKGLAFSPDGKTLASACGGCTARLWDVTTGKEDGRFRGHSHALAALGYSPDGKRLATAGDQTIRLWDPATGEELRRLDGHTGRVTAVAFAPDGKTLASGSFDR